jgi:hybrid cluster-associated redox disulfide protein
MDTNTNPIKEFQIQPDMKVEAALQRWPETIPVFVKHRMACVGCIMAGFESISGAAKIYRLPLNGFLEELQQAIRESGK